MKIIIFIRQILLLTTSKYIRIGDKLTFPFIYPYFLFLNFITDSNNQKSIRRTYFIGGILLKYFGNHRNLALDHIAEHINHYCKYYINAKLIIDVGGSFGTFSLMTSYVNPTCTIISVEPGEISFSILKENVGENKNITPLNMAIGRRSGKAQFFEDLDYPEGSRLLCDNDSVIPVLDKTTVAVPQTSLNDLIFSKKINSVDLIKIDTEGFELDVLLGANDILKITKFLIVEISLINMKHLVEILTLLELHKFRIVDVGSLNRSNRGYVDSMDFVFLNIEIK